MSTLSVLIRSLATWAALAGSDLTVLLDDRDGVVLAARREALVELRLDEADDVRVRLAEACGGARLRAHEADLERDRLRGSTGCTLAAPPRRRRGRCRAPERRWRVGLEVLTPQAARTAPMPGRERAEGSRLQDGPSRRAAVPRSRSCSDIVSSSSSRIRWHDRLRSSPTSHARHAVGERGSTQRKCHLAHPRWSVDPMEAPWPMQGICPSSGRNPCGVDCHTTVR